MKQRGCATGYPDKRGESDERTDQIEGTLAEVARPPGAGFLPVHTTNCKTLKKAQHGIGRRTRGLHGHCTTTNLQEARGEQPVGSTACSPPAAASMV